MEFFQENIYNDSWNEVEDFISGTMPWMTFSSAQNWVEAWDIFIRARAPYLTTFDLGESDSPKNKYCALCSLCEAAFARNEAEFTRMLFGERHKNLLPKNLNGIHIAALAYNLKERFGKFTLTPHQARKFLELPNLDIYVEALSDAFCFNAVRPEKVCRWLDLYPAEKVLETLTSIVISLESPIHIPTPNYHRLTFNAALFEARRHNQAIAQYVTVMQQGLEETNRGVRIPLRAILNKNPDETIGETEVFIVRTDIELRRIAEKLNNCAYRSNHTARLHRPASDNERSDFILFSRDNKPYLMELHVGSTEARIREVRGYSNCQVEPEALRDIENIVETYFGRISSQNLSAIREECMAQS